MEFISTQKYILMTPKKIRLVADIAKKMSPMDAIAKLSFTDKRAALPVTKVIKSAMANAKVKGMSDESLYIKEIQINEGPRLKRGIPVSRGQWHPIKKRMSHIRVVLATKVIEKAKEEIVKQEKIENPKTKTMKKAQVKKAAAKKNK